MAQASLTALVAARGITAQVDSAGLLPGGATLPVETVDALQAVGLGPLPDYTSARVTVDGVKQADLVLGMTREHVRELIVAVPDAWQHTFTLKELVRRGETIGPRGSAEVLDEWLRRLSEERTRAELLGSSLDDDVVDPIGGTPAEFERTAREIDGLCRALVALVWPEPGPLGVRQVAR
jgi:protein-tyrosine phosphatase